MDQQRTPLDYERPNPQRRPRDFIRGLLIGIGGTWFVVMAVLAVFCLVFLDAPYGFAVFLVLGLPGLVVAVITHGLQR